MKVFILEYSNTVKLPYLELLYVKIVYNSNIFVCNSASTVLIIISLTQNSPFCHLGLTKKLHFIRIIHIRFPILEKTNANINSIQFT